MQELWGFYASYNAVQVSMRLDVKDMKIRRVRARVQNIYTAVGWITAHQYVLK